MEIVRPICATAWDRRCGVAQCWDGSRAYIRNVTGAARAGISDGGWRVVCCFRASAVCWGSFCCSGQHQETRQAKDHPKAAYEAWHTAWRYPFRARRDWQSQAHLHTTLNKSRDEKLEIVGVWPTYPFGKRACIMGERLNPAASVGNRTRCRAGSRGAVIPRDVC